MEIEQHLQALRPGSFDAALDVREVAVFSPGRVVPEADADQVRAMFLEDGVDVFGRAIVAEDRAAIVHFVREGKIGAEIEFVRRSGRQQRAR